PVHAHLRAGLGAGRRGRRARGQHHRPLAALRLHLPGVLPDRRRRRRARPRPRRLRRRAGARQRRYRSQVPVAGWGRVLHLRADGGHPAGQAAGPVRAGMTAGPIDGAAAARQAWLGRGRWHWAESLPWLAAIACFFLFPGYMAFGTQVIVMIIFTLSLDLILGYAGIVTLGHAAYFGAGAYATGIASAHFGWGEPISGLLIGAAAGAALGFVSGLVLLRYHGLTLIMLTLVVAILLQEWANVQEVWTGGFDGLLGISIAPIFGVFEN